MNISFVTGCFFGLFLFFFNVIEAQEEVKSLTAIVVNSKNRQIIPNVNVLNIHRVKGTVTNSKGEFTVDSAVNDTIYLSYLGFKSIKIRVTNDMFRFKTEINLTESAYALEEVVVRPYKLTGDLYIDVKYVPFNIAKQYSISGLETTGYESGGSYRKNVFSKFLGAVSNPADFLYNTFSKDAKNMRKLIKMRKNQEIRRMLAEKFDRETLVAFLQIEKKDLESILRNCNYSQRFIKNSNDLQILEAISDCYEEYKVLEK